MGTAGKKIVLRRNFGFVKFGKIKMENALGAWRNLRGHLDFGRGRGTQSTRINQDLVLVWIKSNKNDTKMQRCLWVAAVTLKCG